jgi:hypothetical protein
MENPAEGWAFLYGGFVMIRRVLLGTVLALSCMGMWAATAGAQEKAGTTAPSAASDGGIKLFLMDGSILAGKLGTQQIDVQTKYGTLKVPLADIRSFTPGLASHSEFNAKLQALIGDLGADGFAEREKATDTLRKMGPDIRNELAEALKTAETEKQARLTKLIEEIDQNKGGDDDSPGDAWMKNDIVVTNDFTISGQILTKSFDVSSNYGTLSVKLGDVKSVRREGTVPDETRRTFAVAGTLIQQRSFENTNIRVNKGDIVVVSASGTISLQQFAGGGASSGPDGTPNYGAMQPGNLPTGSLIAKFNQNGPLFKVGSKGRFVADRAGVLMFGIAMQNEYANYQFPGEYSVKVTVIRKGQ